MKVQLVYMIIEHSDDEPPEPFGSYVDYLDQPLREAGEVIQLRWLDGRLAHKVRILRRIGMTLHVRDYDAYDGFCFLWREIYAHWETYGQPPHYRKTAEYLAGGGFIGAAMRGGRAP